MAIIGILKEPEGENRVVALPEIAAQLVKMNFQVLVESGAGGEASQVMKTTKHRAQK